MANLVFLASIVPKFSISAVNVRYMPSLTTEFSFAVELNVTFRSGATPVESVTILDVVLSSNVCSCCSLSKYTVYNELAVCEYLKFSGICMSYVNLMLSPMFIFSFSFNSIKYDFTLLKFATSCFHPFSGLFRSLSALPFSL